MTTSPKSCSGSPKSDFSIEHILTRAGVKKEPSPPCVSTELTWLQCTRYCPPKLPRSQKKEGPQKRQLGRHPRIPFSSHQLAVLEEKFKHSPYLSSSEVTQLSQALHLADVRVKIWFQNRRARERRERNEQSSQSTNHSSSPLHPIEVTMVPTTNSSVVQCQLGTSTSHSTSPMERVQRLDFRDITCLIKNENTM